MCGEPGEAASAQLLEAVRLWRVPVQSQIFWRSKHTVYIQPQSINSRLSVLIVLLLPLCCAVNPKSAQGLILWKCTKCSIWFFHYICWPGSTWFDSVWLEVCIKPMICLSWSPAKCPHWQSCSTNSVTKMFNLLQLLHIKSHLKAFHFERRVFTSSNWAVHMTPETAENEWDETDSVLFCRSYISIKSWTQNDSFF